MKFIFKFITYKMYCYISSWYLEDGFHRLMGFFFTCFLTAEVYFLLISHKLGIWYFRTIDGEWRYLDIDLYFTKITVNADNTFLFLTPLILPLVLTLILSLYLKIGNRYMKIVKEMDEKYNGKYEYFGHVAITVIAILWWGILFISGVIRI